jgi:hypothetical protein
MLLESRVFAFNIDALEIFIPLKILTLFFLAPLFFMAFVLPAQNWITWYLCGNVKTRLKNTFCKSALAKAKAILKKDYPKKVNSVFKKQAK